MRSRTLSNRMLHNLVALHHQHNACVKQVSSLFPLFPINRHFFTTSLEEHQPTLPSPSTHKTNDLYLNAPSVNFHGIAESVILKSSHLWDKKGQNFCNPSLKDHLLHLSSIPPKHIRRFWRISELKPEHVLEILLGFDFDTAKFEIEAKKVEPLWGIFKWASEQSRDFRHLPQSCKVMASILVRAGLFRDVEFLLSKMGSEEILLDSHEIFSELIEGYVATIDLKGAVSTYDRMRGLGLVPSLPSYRALLNYLVQVSDTHLVYRVFVDMLDMGLGVSVAEKSACDSVIQLLCRDGKVQEARNLVKKVITFGMEPNKLVLDAIAIGYCEKKDYDDLLSFFAEVNRAPDDVVGNKIIFSLCRNFGVERAIWFLQELELLGYSPDEITFGILIGCSCRERKLKNAFSCLSEVFSRGLKPHIYSYNALIGGVFQEGMWTHAREVLHEIYDRGVTPDMSTFRVLLAGYCKARQFDEVKSIVAMMADRGLIQLSSLDDPVSKAFMVLGLNQLTVRVRRDNDFGFSKTEFFDNLGNGLYLETDMDEYEKTMTGVLDGSMIPDYTCLVLQDCRDKNLKNRVVMLDEMVRWGQELSLSAFSTLLKELCALSCSTKAITSLLDKFPKLTNQLDQETLNLLVQVQSRKGYTHRAKVIVNQMLHKHLHIKNETYTALLTSLCKRRNLRWLDHFWLLAREDKWLPELSDCKVLIGNLCQREMLKETLELFEAMLVGYPLMVSDTFHAFLEKLCDMGFTGTAHDLAQELSNRGCVVDRKAYNYLIGGFCKEKRFSEAFRIADTMLAKNMTPQFDVSVLLIRQLCSAGKSVRAVSLMEIVSREQPSVSLSSHCALMSGYCRKGMVGEAASLVQDILLKGLIPDTAVYNVLIQGFSQAKNFRKVGEILAVMIRKNMSISISSYRKLVSSMCMEGRIPFASSVKEHMLKESNPSYIIIYNILIFYLFLSGNSALVDTLLDEFQGRGFQPDVVTYDFLVYGFCRCKAVSTSLQHLSAMMSKGLRPSNRSLKAVITSLCYGGELVQALKLSHEMEYRGILHGSVIQNGIVEGLLTHGKFQEAVNFLNRMVEKGLIPENINYDNLIKRLSWCGSQEKAVDLLDIMLKRGNTPNYTSYDSLIQGFCTCHKLDEALDFHSEMLNRNLKPNIKTWTVLIHNLCEDGKTEKAEMLLHSMVQEGEIPSREIYCSIVDRYRSENSLRRASELLHAMQQKGYEPDFETQWSLIRNLSTSNDKNNADNSGGFLSRLLSDSGFVRRRDPKAKLGCKA